MRNWKNQKRVIKTKYGSIKKKKKKLLRRFKDVRSFLIKKLVFIRSWTDGERREWAHSLMTFTRGRPIKTSPRWLTVEKAHKRRKNAESSTLRAFNDFYSATLKRFVTPRWKKHFSQFERLQQNQLKSKLSLFPLRSIVIKSFNKKKKNEERGNILFRWRAAKATPKIISHLFCH